MHTVTIHSTLTVTHWRILWRGVDKCFHQTILHLTIAFGRVGISVTGAVGLTLPRSRRRRNSRVLGTELLGCVAASLLVPATRTLHYMHIQSHTGN